MTRTLSRLALIAAVFAPAAAGRAESVIQLPASGHDRYFRVVEPNVQQRESDYPNITFEPGDVVRIRAGGCVQTGGRGLTWKRYVQPFGPNSDRFYHGLFQIPGAMSNLEAISYFVNDNGTGTSGSGATAWSAPITVPTHDLPPDLYLRLGYTDDQYDDNGYWGHDNGTQNQCQGVGNAFFDIVIHPPV